jgi:hypothetical protein
LPCERSRDADLLNFFQTTQWPKKKVQKDKQRSTRHSHKTKDRVTRTPIKTGVNSGPPEG